MDLHYEMTSESRVIRSSDGQVHQVYRIRCLRDTVLAKAGDLGGFIERMENLTDAAWVGGDSVVYGKSTKVYGAALVSGQVEVGEGCLVFGDSVVYDSARLSNVVVGGSVKIYGSSVLVGDNEGIRVFGNSRVYGLSRILGHVVIDGDVLIFGDCEVRDSVSVSGAARIHDYAVVSGEAKVTDDAYVHGSAKVYGRAMLVEDCEVYGDAEVFGNSLVGGIAKVYGSAKVRDYAEVSGTARVYGDTIVGGDVVLSDRSYTSGVFDKFV